MLPQKRGGHKSLLSVETCVRSSRSLVASPGAEAALCEVGVMISLEKAQGFLHSVSRRKNLFWFAVWVSFVPPLRVLQDLSCRSMTPEAHWSMFGHPLKS